MTSEPQIQFAQTEDGVTIAYWAIGTGPPLIMPSGNALTSSLRAWRQPEGRAFFERLAAHRTFVRYDGRGVEQSQGAMPDFRLEAVVRDLDAVLDAVGAEQAALLGYVNSGRVVLAYAAERPERVSHLILWATTTRGFQMLSDETWAALDALAEADSELFTEALAVAFARAGAGDRAAYAKTLGEMDPQAIRQTIRAPSEDMAHVLPDIRSPTLVLHRRGIASPTVADIRDLAARISGARLVLLEGDSMVPYGGDADAVLAAIEPFVGVEPSANATAKESGGLVTILFTDLVSSTALTQQLGDAAAQELVRAHNAIVRDALQANRGSEIKHTGDGIMASFPTASAALGCAIAIQRAVDERGDPNLQVHAGLNAGEPVVEDDDIFGTAVQLARRICDQSASGEILVSNVVRELAAGKDFLFADRGDVALRGFEDPVRVYETRWQNA